MYKPESILKNETHKILRDFEIQTDHIIHVRRPNLVIINKKENLSSSGFCHSNRPHSENKRKWKERQVLRRCQNCPQELGKRA